MKMKKMMFLMLTLLIWGTASMNAQVTIGSEKAPHSGAILDLQSDNLGLKLPNVALDDDLTVFGLPDTDPAADAKGMYVYNTNPKVGEGVYVWDGGQWLLVKASVGENPVTGITISYTGSRLLELGTTFQLSAILTPENPSNPHIVWSIDKNPNIATVDENGLVTAIGVGGATIKASASNGVSGVVNLFVQSDSYFTKEKIGENDYQVAAFGSRVWMVENLKEIPSAGAYKTSYNGDGTVDVNVNGGAPMPAGERGYYYTSAAAAVVCQSPWRLPTVADAEQLLLWWAIDDVSFHPRSRNFWWYLGGGRTYNDGTWVQWGRANLVRLQNNYVMVINSYSQYIQASWATMNSVPVRCVRDI
ncbi:hypothetical protein FACS189437_05800 [Bacteroidia bacterium]|nr:hypothetical protein FACS189437_05800 [Bacteroidia bacterium]